MRESTVCPFAAGGVPEELLPGALRCAVRVHPARRATAIARQLEEKLRAVIP
jgi:hypothetical protein